MPPKKKGGYNNKKKNKGKDKEKKNAVRKFGNQLHSNQSRMTGEFCSDRAVDFEAKLLLDKLAYPMEIEEARDIMRRLAELSGTDNERNDDDPFGNGDQSPCGEIGLKGEEKRQILRTLFANGGDLMTYLVNGGWSSFTYACVIGDVGTVEDMLSSTKFGSKERMELLERRETGMRFPPLILTLAAHKSKYTVADIQCVPEVEMDHLAVFKLLLLYGADPSCKELTGKTVVHYGAGSYAEDLTLKMTEYCIDACKTSRHFGKDVILQNLTKTEYNGCTGKLGGYIADSGRRQVILDDGKELSLLPKNIFVKVDNEEKSIYDPDENLVNNQDRTGMLSMHEVFMSQRQRLDVAEFLIQHKVDIDIEDYGQTSVRKMAFISPAISDMSAMIRKYSTEQSKSESKQCLNCGLCATNVLSCSRCKVATYCSVNCQKQHWKEHKKKCKEVSHEASVKLSRPMFRGKNPIEFLRNNKDGSTDYGEYQVPDGVSVDEIFWMKVQIAKNGPLFLYDKTRSCAFLYNPNQVGFEEMKEKVQAEKAYMGKKAYLKASFGEDGDCTVHLQETSIKKW